MAGAGDVNGDGFADVLVTAGTASEGGTNRGAAFIVFGAPAGFGATVNLDALGAGGFRISGAADGMRLGDGAAGLGDVNGDGFGDFAITAIDPTSNQSGTGYVIFGKPGGFGTGMLVTNLDGTNGFKLRGGAAGDSAGTAIAAGDFNGDGFSDAFIGAPYVGATNAGVAYVAFGTGTVVKFSADGRTATFTETDGDLVTVKITKGLLKRSDLVINSIGGLSKLSLRSENGAFAGASVSITAKKAVGGSGDGKANLGGLDARGSDLGKVSASGKALTLTPGKDNLPVGAGTNVNVVEV